MNPLWLIPLFIAVSFVAGFLFFSRRLRRLSPRALQRQQRGIFYYMLGVLLLVMLAEFLSGGTNARPVLTWIPLILVLAYSGFRTLTPREHLQSFALDTLHCGRCEYDLTGNVSGVCPECGWVVPQGPVAVEPLNWALWWQRWEIPHLDNWRRSLLQTVLVIMAFSGLTVWMVSRGNYLAFLPAFMCLHFAINAWRVVSYGRRTQPR